MYKNSLRLLLAFVAIGGSTLAQAEDTLLLQQPALSKDHVAFVYADDIWLCERSGGRAWRLTSAPGLDSAPRFSPDGKNLAYSAQYDGNFDVYILPTRGGLARRLTWHPGADTALGWTPDGREVLFRSSRAGGTPVDRLYAVSVEGGEPRGPILPKVYNAAMAPDGQRIAMTAIAEPFRTWKRYRGGRTTPIWIFDQLSRQTTEVPHPRANDTAPCWLGGRLYFLSDRDGLMDIYAYDPKNPGEVQRITEGSDFDISSLSAGPDALIFDRAGAVHIWKPGDSAPTRLRIDVVNDGLGARPRWQNVGNSVHSASISPDGQRVAFECRGEIITLPREEGPSRNLTQSPGAHDRNPTWSPDGRWIAWFSDASGEYELVITDQLGQRRPRSFKLGGKPFYFQLSWAPDSKRLAYSDKQGRLAIIDLSKKGAIREVDSCRASLGVYVPDLSWHPSGRYLAFERRNPITGYDTVAIIDLETGALSPIGRGFACLRAPRFSPDGRLLYLRASTDTGPHRFGLDLSSTAARPHSERLFVAVLDPKDKNPLARASDESRHTDPGLAPWERKKRLVSTPEGEASKASIAGSPVDSSGQKPADTPAPAAAAKPLQVLDLRGIDERILTLPIPAARYGNLAPCSEGLYLHSHDRGALIYFELKNSKHRDISTGIWAFERAADGKHLLIRKGPTTWVITNNLGQNEQRVDPSNEKIFVDPAAEWPQILREAWRIQRDFFYDPAMHGVDWDAMWTRWSQFLPQLRHRNDLNLLLKEMLGELACGHEYVSGGELHSGPPPAAQVGLLGADLRPDDAGGFRILRIFHGQNWNPDARAPLTEPGVDVQVGDRITAVDGREIKTGQNFHELMTGKADRRTLLTIAPRKGEKDSHEVNVLPLSNDWGLRYLDWIERNRKRVEDLSEGKLGYIYLPDTATGGLRSFERDFYAQLDKQGLVIDERYNRGGKVADHIVEVLGRKPDCYWGTREAWIGRTPFAAMLGPKIMVTNEYAGSGGDALPWLFRQHKLGKLVGTRTWGGLVGISGTPQLMDGGSVTSAAFGIMDLDGNWIVENEGVAPDIEVVEDLAALLEDRDPQLERAIREVLAELAANPPKGLPALRSPTPR